MCISDKANLGHIQKKKNSALVNHQNIKCLNSEIGLLKSYYEIKKKYDET